MKKEERVFFKRLLKPVIINILPTIESGVKKVQQQEVAKTFSAADLWNIQRHKRNTGIRSGVVGIF